MYNGLLVWQPQNNAADHALFTSWGIDWYPAAWAGHSLAGQEYWTNIYNIVATEGVAHSVMTCCRHWVEDRPQRAVNAISWRAG